jgi:hypothetical protein
MKNFESIESICSEIGKGTFGIYCATLTPKKMNKYPTGCKRIKGTENPYEGRVETLTIYQNMATGKSYYAIVESECEREGIHFSKEEFAIAFPKESTYCEGIGDKLDNVIMEHPMTHQRYLRIYEGSKRTKVLHYTIITDADGSHRIVADGSTEMQDIARYLPPFSTSKKQEALGISNIVKVKQPKVENVIFIKQGDKQYINPMYRNIFADGIIGELGGLFK